MTEQPQPKKSLAARCMNSLLGFLTGGQRAEALQGDKDQWYFAFGSNMHPSVLTGRRRVVPAESRPARLAHWRLTFSLPGIAGLEPAFANLEYAEGCEVHGVVHRISEAEVNQIKKTEGEDYCWDQLQVDTEQGPLTAYVLIAPEKEEPLLVGPSRRYLALLVDGAKHHGLPAPYIAWLEAHPARPVQPLLLFPLLFLLVPLLLIALPFQLLVRLLRLPYRPVLWLSRLISPLTQSYQQFLRLSRIDKCDYMPYHAQYSGPVKACDPAVLARLEPSSLRSRK